MRYITDDNNLSHGKVGLRITAKKIRGQMQIYRENVSMMWLGSPTLAAYWSAMVMEKPRSIADLVGLRSQLSSTIGTIWTLPVISVISKWRPELCISWLHFTSAIRERFYGSRWFEKTSKWLIVTVHSLSMSDQHVLCRMRTLCRVKISAFR